MPSKRFATVDQYLASLDETKRKTMRELIDLITSEFPELEVKIAWNLPMIHTQGKYIVGLAAYKNHISFSPWSTTILESFATRLSDYVTTKNLFKIPVDWQIDVSLVRDLVSARLAEVQKDRQR
jgi:uncharacterized protein YdhG (YjbR/CyaY superfamily)